MWHLVFHLDHTPILISIVDVNHYFFHASVAAHTVVDTQNLVTIAWRLHTQAAVVIRLLRVATGCIIIVTAVHIIHLIVFVLQLKHG